MMLGCDGIEPSKCTPVPPQIPGTSRDPIVTPRSGFEDHSLFKMGLMNCGQMSFKWHA